MKQNAVYQWIRDSEDVFSERAERDIELNRKGFFTLVFRDSDGKLLENVESEVHLKELDFNFGANIFMLGEYDTEKRCRDYEEKFCALFNSAAIPLYWEGTEPEQGYLRYGMETPRDIYRRPPADSVVDFCRAHGLRMKGHPLFWHEFIPMWLPENFEELKPFIVKRFGEIAERYAADIERFDVVNEPSRIYDVYFRDRRTANKFIVPPDDYCVWLFDLARQLFPANTLILNDTVGAAFEDFRGKYSGYYLTIRDLLSRGVRIDEIGMQCHLGASSPRNVYNAEILYDVLDTYASLDRPINISEISIPSVFQGERDEDLQALAAERLYKVCFSHRNVTGITWWNLPDDGVLTTRRVAANENMPSTGLLDPDYGEKKAYRVLRRLIREEWRTDFAGGAPEGSVRFRGFYGKYELTARVGGRTFTQTLDLSRGALRVKNIVLS